MIVPVFEHTVSSLHSIITNENEPLQKVSRLLRYDPGLFFSLMHSVSNTTQKKDITSISQAISLIGADGVENLILQQDYFLDEEYTLLWCYSVLLGETATIINERFEVAEEEEAFFSGIIPVIGMLLMLVEFPKYKKLTELLLKLSIEDRLFIEWRLFKTTHLELFGKALSSPKIYRDILDYMGLIFSSDGQRKKHLDYSAKFSVAYQSYQLFHLLETAEVATQTILYPSLAERQGTFKELCKKHFRIPEHDAEEVLSEIVSRFEAVCTDFKVQKLAASYISAAEVFRTPEITFSTRSEALQASLKNIYEANRSEKNILIYGDACVGKPLLAAALHFREDNPRKTKPFVICQCSVVDTELLEAELFGARGGFRGLEKHKGTLELANGGTILLKDADQLPVTLQDRLAEIFSKDEFYGIGETSPKEYSIRFIITSRKNIVEEAGLGNFSAELIKVLDPTVIYLPPLRERREDVELIAGRIIEKYNLNLTDPVLLMGLREYYETDRFENNLKDLKRSLFYLSAKRLLES